MEYVQNHIIPGVWNVLILILLYKLFIQKPKPKKREEVWATIVHKDVGRMESLLLGIPRFDDVYEVTFSIDDVLKTFEISVFEYECVEIGDSGKLVFEGTKLISFADAIKEFHLDT